MRIEVNGEARELSGPTTLLALLESLGLGQKPVAVERNTVIVPRAKHAITALEEGDKLEVVHFVGGG